MPKNLKKRIAQIETLISPSEVEIFDAILDVEKDVENLDGKVQGIENTVDNIKETLKDVKSIEGRPGKDGKDGKEGKPGKDGKPGKNGRDGFDGEDGKNGKDGSPDAPKDIRNKLASLIGDERLDASAIKNLPFKRDGLAKDGYPYRLPQPAASLTYFLNNANIGRGNQINIVGTGIVSRPIAGGDGIVYDFSGFVPSGGGGGNPAAPLYGVQYNNPLGTFDADAQFTRNPLTGEFAVERSSGVFTTEGFYLTDFNGTVASALMEHTDGTGRAFNLVGDATSFGLSQYANIAGSQDGTGNESLVALNPTSAVISNTDGSDTGRIQISPTNISIDGFNIVIGDASGLALTTQIKIADSLQRIAFNYGGDTYIFPIGKPTTDYVLADDGTGTGVLAWRDVTSIVTIDDLLPSQTGNSGKFLTTNGTAASWGLVPSASVSLTATEVAYGSAGNTMISSSGLIFIAASNKLVVNGIAIWTAGHSGNTLVGNGAGANMDASDHDNTVIGQNALNADTGAFQSVIIGTGAAAIASTTIDSIAIGWHAAGSSTGLGGGIFIGSEAGLVNTGISNVFIGTRAGKANDNGMNNVFVGYESGFVNDLGDRNTFVGFQTGLSGNGNNFQANTFIGYCAGTTSDSFGYNTFVGSQAGLDNSTGSNSTYLGALSGIHATGSFNVYLGHNAGGGNGVTANSGLNNVYVGYNAGALNTTGTGNTLLGHQAGDANTTGNNNIFFGKDAGGGNTTGSTNIFIGTSAGISNTTEDDNIAIGFHAYQLGANGTHNIAIGQGALENNTGSPSYSGSVAIGYLALNGTPGGVTTNNTAVGYRAGIVNTGDSNTFIGFNAGQSNTSGSGNTSLGYGAGEGFTTGNDNLCLGYSAQGPNTGSRVVLIGALASVNNGADHDSIALGYNARLGGSGSNMFVVGDESSPINTMYIGEGIISPTPSTFSLTVTGGDASASNIAAGAFYIEGGVSRGNSTPGALIFTTTTPVASGITQQTPSTRLTIDGFRSYMTAFRFETAKGANVAAANDLTLGLDGNVFIITGNTTINAITTANWQAGSEITLVFTGTPTVKNNTAGGAGTAVLFLAGSVDLVAANHTILCLCYDGTQWQETSRKAA